jgi:hypothetical protein
MQPLLWQLQTAVLELLRYVLAHAAHMRSLLDWNAPASLCVQELRFVFPAPCGELAIEDDIEGSIRSF